MGIAHAAQPADASQEGDREPPVHEAIMHHDVGEAEDGHAGSRADGRSRDEPVHVASDHDERGGDGGVRRRERVVRLETPLAARMVRPMDAPERPVPHAAVEEARPWLHRGCHDQRERHAEQDVTERAHGGAS
jgi:hypothetical protein